MSRRTERIAAALLASAFAVGAFAQGKFPGVGRAATSAEVSAWDIDVRRDFAGLPAGSGSVAHGQDLWEARCASCHGTFGESNEVFTPIAGGTTPGDIARGRVAGLVDPVAGRTALMKLASVSTLWDYVRRAKPWDAPRTLAVDDVYAITAYILHLGDIVPADFTLSERNIASVQAKLPNRDGLTRDHGLWEVGGRPDVKSVACMRDCPVEPRDPMALPDHTRNDLGHLLAQHRVIGPVRGADTMRPALTGPAGSQAADLRSAALATIGPVPAGVDAPGSGSPSGDGRALAIRHACTTCHALEQKGIGPSLREIAGRYRGESNALEVLLDRVQTGGAGIWGQTVMPAQGSIHAADLRQILQWMLGPQ